MKNILVAIDFSDTSIAVFNYAVQLAKELDSKLTLMHVISIPMATESGLISPAYSIPYNVATERLEYFVENVPKEKDIDVSNIEIIKRIEAGTPAFSIPQVAEELDADLIVMGTISKSGIFSRMIGTVTTATINNAPCPVMLIHRNTRYTKPQKLVFGIDTEGNLEESLESFNELNESFKGYTEFVHVNTNDGKSISGTKHEIVEELVEENEVNYSFEIKQIDGKNPSQDIIDYCLFAKADLLVLVHHEKNLFERMFTGSSSFKAAEKIHLPVLIIPEH